MEKIKMMLPLWLILFYFGSALFMFQSRTDTSEQYNQLVKNAREYAENDILVDAYASYEAALDMRPDLDLMLEVGGLYLKNEDYRAADDWYNYRLHTTYPNQVETYEYGMDLYLAQDNYRQAFVLYDEIKNRDLSSEKVESMMKPIWYTFDTFGQYEDVCPFGNNSGIAAVKYNGYWGYITTSGERLLNYDYISAGTFSDVAAVVDKEGNAYFIDAAGNKKITEKSILEHDQDLGKAERFLGIEGGVLWAYDGKYWYCYDAESFDRKFGGYTAATSITYDTGAVADDKSKWALIGSDGTLRTDFIYDGVLTDGKDIFCRTDSVFVQKGDRYLLLRKEGDPIEAAEYEEACAFYDDTYAAVKCDGRWVFIDPEGKIQDLGTYDQAESFSGGYAAVCRDGKWGYIDKNGNLVIDYQFDAAGPFCTRGISFVKQEGDDYWKMLTLYKDNH